MIPYRQRKRKLRKLIGLCIIIAIPIIGIYSLLQLFQPKPSVKGIEDTQIEDQQAIPLPAPTHIALQASQPLGNAIADALSGSHGDYGIVIMNLKTGEGYQQHEDTVYNSASLYKLWVMGAVYQQIAQGKLHENDVLHKDVQALGKEFHVTLDPTGQTKGVLTLSVKDALYQMITISDNNAALLLTDKVGLQNIDAFLKHAELTQSRLGINGDDPTTTPSDIALFFDKLYNGQLTNKTYTDDMINLLKQQRLNEKIPQYLPFDVDIAHKTGELDNYSHDAGILYTPNGDIIVVVMSESDDPSLANGRIANIAHAVYNYFNPQ